MRIVVAGVNPTDWKSRAGPTGRRVRLPGARPGRRGRDRRGRRRRRRRRASASACGSTSPPGSASGARRRSTASCRPSRRCRCPPARRSSSARRSGIPALTAYHCLLADGPIERSDVLVAGGAGAVGHAAIELARVGGRAGDPTVSGEEKAELAERRAPTRSSTTATTTPPSRSARPRRTVSTGSSSSRWGRTSRSIWRWPPRTA